MVNSIPQEVCKNLQVLQIPKIQEEIGEEIEILYDLGVECYELEYLVYLKIKENVTIKEI
jgi:hypothetical protein